MNLLNCIKFGVYAYGLLQRKFIAFMECSKMSLDKVKSLSHKLLCNNHSKIQWPQLPSLFFRNMIVVSHMAFVDSQWTWLYASPCLGFSLHSFPALQIFLGLGTTSNVLFSRWWHTQMWKLRLTSTFYASDQRQLLEFHWPKVNSCWKKLHKNKKETTREEGGSWMEGWGRMEGQGGMW